MKITVSQLRRIIKEEVQRSLMENKLPEKKDLYSTLEGLKVNDNSYIVYKDGSELTITRTGDTEYTLTGPDGTQTFAPSFPMPGPMGQGLALNNLLNFLYNT